MGASYDRYSKIRDSMKMTDYAVAKKAGIGKSTFADWKSGRSCPKSGKLEKIAEALGVSYDELVGIGDQELWLTDDDNALLIMFKELNEIGQKKVLEYVSDLYDRYKTDVRSRT